MAGTGSEHSSEDQFIATGQLANTAIEGGERPVDRLSTLPPEILSAIFKLVGKPVGQPLSKHLLPFYPEQLYSNIQLWHSKPALKLSRLLRTIVNKPELARRIREIDIGVPLRFRVAPQNELGDRDEHVRQAHAFLRNLPHLRKVTLRNLHRLAEPFLRHEVGEHAHLTSLTLLDICEDHDGRDLSNYNQLHLYPSLRSLTIVDPKQATVPLANGPVPPLFGRLTSLTIDPCRADLGPFEPALMTCHNLRELCIFSVYPRSTNDFPALLFSLPQPDTLQVLDLTSYDSAPGPSSPLMRFTALTQLTLSGPLFPLRDPILYPFLSSLPLQSLTFGEDADPDPVLLLRFLQHPPSTLRLFELDNVEAYMRVHIDPDVDNFYLNDDGVAHLYEDMLDPPQWENGWSSDAVLALRDAASEAGVEFRGDSLYAVEVEEVWNREQAKVDRYNAKRAAELEEGAKQQE